jgi:hypothetical protein
MQTTPQFEDNPPQQPKLSPSSANAPNEFSTSNINRKKPSML